MLAQAAQTLQPAGYPVASHNSQRIVVLCVSAVGALGTFLPWVSLGALGSAEGTRGDGWITLALFAVTFLIAILGNRREAISTSAQVGAVFAAIACALVAIYDLSSVRMVPFANIGGGLYLVTFASVIVVGAIALGRRLIPGVIAVLAAAATIFFGFAHIPYGTSLPTTRLCAKSTWSLKNTFPNLDDYIGKRIGLADAPVVEALVDCGVLTKTEQHQETKFDEPAKYPQSSPRCQVPNADNSGRAVLGRCEPIDSCTTPAVYYQGYCEGPADIICCVQP